MKTTENSLTIEQLSPVTYAIVGEIATALNTLGAKSDLMSIVMSWGDTLPEDQILSMLQEWNAQ